MSKKLTVSFSPHIKDCETVSSMTYTTIAALMPAVLVGFYVFGIRAVVVVVLAVLAAVGAEAGLQRAMGKPVSIKDGTAVLIGLLLACLLPVGAPWWAVIAGSFVAIFLGRVLFGGLGGNPFNAVLVGWVVMRLSWSDAVSLFHEPTPLFEGWGQIFALDASELPLGILKYGDSAGVFDFYPLWSTLVGNIPGGIGSTSVIALALGGLYLVYRRIVPWQIPAGFLGGMFLFSLLFWLADGDGSTYANPFHHLIFGYTLIGAFFLAPDPATSPYSRYGGLIYGVGAGVLTMIIRYWGAYQDGVFFALLFFNALTPMLDRINPKSYGLVKTTS